MLDLKDLDCLLALTLHRHFARAAEHCGMSQPAFSMRIRNLEDRLGTQIVKRGNRFQGLTEAGETVVSHARGILDGVRALEEEMLAAKGEIVGTLSIGAIPTTSAYAALAAHRLCKQHPGIRTRIDTATSLLVQQGVDEGRFDAGLTYIEGVATDLLKVEPLYDEEYVLFAPLSLVKEKAEGICWSEAATLPLILLEREMQNRRLIDEIFSDIGTPPKVVAETSGFIAAITMAREGMGATILPRVMVETLGKLDNTLLMPLIEPTIAKPVGLITPKRAQSIPVVEALRRIVAPEVQ